MKKFLITAAVLSLFCGTASAQMSDTLGALVIDGELSAEGYKAVARGQSALNKMRFQQDLGSLVTEIQTSYFGDYSGLSKAALPSFSGFPGINWDIAPADDGGFYVTFDGLDGATCFMCQNGTGARRAEINSGGSCQQSGNKVKLLF